MKKFKYRLSVWKLLRPFWKGVNGWYTGDIVSDVLIRMLNLLFPVAYGILLERVIIGKQKELLVWVLMGYLALQMAKSVITVFQKYCQNKVNHKVYRKLRVAALEKYFRRKFASYGTLQTGDVKMTMEDGVNKLNGFQTQFAQYCLNAVFALIMVVVLFGIDWRLALVSFISIPLTFFMDHAVSKAEKGYIEKLDANDASWITWLDETMKSWREIRVYRCEAKRKQEFEEFQATEENCHRTWLRFWVTRVLVIPKIKDEFMMQFVLYFLGGILIYYNQLTIGVLLVFVKYFGILSDSIKAVSVADATLQSEQVHYERVLRHLNEEIEDETDGEVVPGGYEIRFDDVSFAYEGSKTPVLCQKTFRIREGTRVGISGASGAGKSTLIKLLLGQLEPTEGHISYGEYSLKEICKEKLYQRIAYIGQEAKLFQESVAENLRLGKEDATLKEMEEACMKAGIYEYIKGLPEGLNTEIGENGAKLSGGQRQRVLLAKAFLRDADLYIFDEATSALDGQTEEEIWECIKQIPKDKTILIVSHKEDVFKSCDYVLNVG